ncbi:hypothetical protein [Candidatus Soleaferrea massiliensis]|uniref:hypothetical protein n=1 Tax=Candidatus Soleaferrea massiliensis TaxID=1470354 RepID=UPI00058D314E|nr:hypothetical protein [Candidatus Soleaferrea massiliensis]
MSRKNNKRILTAALISAICAVLALAGACVLPSVLQRQTEKLLADIEAVDAFVGEPWDKPFVNQAAVDAFERDHTAAQDEDTLYTYRSPEGIAFISKAEAWDEKNLEALYHELLQNRHGEEFMTLSQVIVYPQRDEFAAATHQNTYQTHRYALDFPALPKDFHVEVNRTAGVISLYDGDRCTTVKSMASNLSHEYGHHFTFYHMFPAAFTDEEFQATKYAKLRGLDPDKVQFNTSDSQYYVDNHHWYLVEIAAEDYVTLMGSPNSRDVGNHPDVRDQLNGASPEQYIKRNSRVQENLMIPMASDVDGLSDYFYSFVDDEPPQFPKWQDIQIDIQRRSASYDLESGYTTFVYYELTWNKAYGDDATYTLVTYQEDDYSNTLHPVRTVLPGTSAVAYVGCVSSQSGMYVSSMDDNLANGTRTFVVTAILPDGTMQASDPMTYTFD